MAFEHVLFWYVSEREKVEIVGVYFLWDFVSRVKAD